jgi:hydroxymethylglutaryl-CoA lyase
MFDSLRNLWKELPAAVSISEVSARDGLQSVTEVLSPQQRARWIRSILDAGVPEAEAGSFVNPRRVPQMAETAAVLRQLEDVADRLWVLVPNLEGLDTAYRANARNVVCLVSATETHSLANLGRPIARVLADLEQVARRIEALRLRARIAVSMAWVDPDEGDVPRERVGEICTALGGMGFGELTLCDTYGGASPRQVAGLLEELSPTFPPSRIGLHLHDTFGVASANVMTGLLCGVTRYDGSIGGLGGCPFVPAARGNVNTEHLVQLLDGLGVRTGIGRAALAKAAIGCLADLTGADATRLA